VANTTEIGGQVPRNSRGGRQYRQDFGVGPSLASQRNPTHENHYMTRPDPSSTFEVNPRQAQLVLEWVTVFGRIYPVHVTSQLGQLSLASLRGRLIEYQLQLG